MKSADSTSTTSSDALGQFDFPNVPFNPYRINVSAKALPN